MVETTFSNMRGFFTDFSQTYKEFAHETSHIHSLLNMTQLLVPKSPLCLKKKIGGMRLWIGTSTFKHQCNTMHFKRQLNLR